MGRDVHSKASTVGGYLVKIRDELVPEVLCVTNSEGGKASKEGLIVLIWIVVLINELG